MKFGIYIHTFDDFSNPRTLAELAQVAEDAGWDGFFLWDVIHSSSARPIGDPWIALSAIAATTRRIRLGPLIVPLARRRPWKVAREAVSLDHLSNGRMVLGVGLGSTSNFVRFGETGDPKTRADMLDEGLKIITGLWCGEPFQFDGEHYQIGQVQFLPKPLQEPRIPIWVACYWPNKAPLRRASRWDGVFPFDGRMQSFEDMLSVSEVTEIGRIVADRRPVADPFDLVQTGVTQGVDIREEANLMSGYAEVGVTWWLEHIYPGRMNPDEAHRRIAAGPPDRPVP